MTRTVLLLANRRNSSPSRPKRNRISGWHWWARFARNTKTKSWIICWVRWVRTRSPIWLGWRKSATCQPICFRVSWPDRCPFSPSLKVTANASPAANSSRRLWKTSPKRKKRSRNPLATLSSNRFTSPSPPGTRPNRQSRSSCVTGHSNPWPGSVTDFPGQGEYTEILTYLITLDIIESIVLFGFFRFFRRWFLDIF